MLLFVNDYTDAGRHNGHGFLLGVIVDLQEKHGQAAVTISMPQKDLSGMPGKRIRVMLNDRLAHDEFGKLKKGMTVMLECENTKYPLAYDMYVMAFTKDRDLTGIALDELTD